MNTLNVKLTFFLFLLSISIHAQEIILSGQILNTEKEPIEFANILLKDAKEIQSPIGSISEMDGRFKINITEPGDYELKISFVGYNDWTKTFKINATQKLEPIILERTANDLREVVVTGERKIIERVEDKLVFNIQSSPLKSGFDGMEVLARSPNVWVDSEGGIQMRNEAATILINGRISNLKGENLSNYISNLRSEDIKAIEIQTNLSANTDAESSGGVINIILKKKRKGIDGNLRSVYTFKDKGDYRNYNSLNFNYGADKWNIYGAYNFQQSTSEAQNDSRIEYFTTQNLLLEDGTFKRLVRRHNYQLGFVMEAAKNHVFGVEGFATNFYSSYDNISLVDVLNEGQSLDQGKAQLIGDTDNDLYNATFNYKWTIDTLKSSLQLFADYASSNVLRFNNAISNYEQGFYAGITERNDATAGTDIFSVQIDYVKYFQKGIKLEVGSKLSNTERENILLSDFLISDEWIPNERNRSFNYTEQVGAAYLSLSKRIADNYFLKIGLRTENTNLERVDLNQDTVISQNYTDWFPSFYISRDLPKDHTISLSYSKRLRRPSFQFLNNYVTKVNDFRFELGNPELRPEYVYNYELSLKQKNKPLIYIIKKRMKQSMEFTFRRGSFLLSKI